MDHKERYKYMSWCLNNDFKIYPITEFAYQEMLVRNQMEAGKMNYGEYEIKKVKLLQQFQNSKQLHIVVETKGIASAGEMIFFEEATKNTKPINEQIELLYKLIYQRETKKINSIQS